MSTRFRLTSSLLATVTAFLAGCGGGASITAPDSKPNAAFLNQAVSGFPHAFDVYQPQVAVRAIVFLHGGLGTKERFAYNLGITKSAEPATDGTVNYEWLNRTRTLAVVPQGQNLAVAPLGRTWNNYVMNSGQDDIAFLRSLASYLKANFGVTKIHVLGHSNGGMMVNRLYCEAPDIFDVHVALAGPGSQHFLDPATLCRPTTKKPYMGLVGALDSTLQVPGNWEATRWTLDPNYSVGRAFVDPVMVGEWTQYVGRAQWVCGETPKIADGTISGNVQTWNNCSGRLRLKEALTLDHDLGMPNATAPTAMLDTAFEFISTDE